MNNQAQKDNPNYDTRDEADGQGIGVDLNESSSEDNTEIVADQQITATAGADAPSATISTAPPAAPSTGVAGPVMGDDAVVAVNALNADTTPADEAGQVSAPVKPATNPNYESRQPAAGQGIGIDLEASVAARRTLNTESDSTPNTTVNGDTGGISVSLPSTSAVAPAPGTATGQVNAPIQAANPNYEGRQPAAGQGIGVVLGASTGVQSTTPSGGAVAKIDNDAEDRLEPLINPSHSTPKSGSSSNPGGNPHFANRQPAAGQGIGIDLSQ